MVKKHLQNNYVIFIYKVITKLCSYGSSFDFALTRFTQDDWGRKKKSGHAELVEASPRAPFLSCTRSSCLPGEALAKSGACRRIRMSFLRILIIFSSIFINLFAENKADLVIFSYNRPLQLYALLESVEKYVKNLSETHIIFRADHDYLDAYKEVEKRFNHYKFHQQGNDPYSDFKILTLECTFSSPEEYIIYAVDDIVVKDEINILQCTQTLQKTNAYGFYLRLGLNIQESYMMFINPTPLPEYNLVDNSICIYTFNNSCGDWRYPNTVDMTIYKKEDIKNDLLSINMVNPTTLEYHWHHLSDYNKKGLFFAESKILNIPLNLCYSQSTNRNMGLYSNQELLTKFKSGLKIDINQFYKINNNSPHMEYVPHFIERK